MRNKQIVEAYNRGVRPLVIAKEHGLSVRQVQRVVRANNPNSPPRIAISKNNQLRELRAIIISLMTSEGRDFATCELCGAGIPKGRFDIHHVRYDGATYSDLRIVCRACNTAPINRYLS